MSQPTPREKFVLTFPHDEKGQEIQFRFMLTLSKKLSVKIGEETIQERLVRALGTLDGIDGMAFGAGRYTVEVTVARTFDAQEVLTELKARLENDVLSEIIRPPVLMS